MTPETDSSRPEEAAEFAYPDETDTGMTRIFRAPPSKVFRLWNDPATIPAIWDDDPSKVVVEKFEYRVGGKFAIRVRGAGDSSNQFFGEFLEIVPDRRIVTAWQSDAPDDTGVVQTEEYEAVGPFTRLTIRWKRVRGPGPDRMAGPFCEGLINTQSARFDRILAAA